MAFPSSPANGQTYASVGGTVYTFNSTIGGWLITGGSGGSTASGKQIVAAYSRVEFGGTHTIASVNIASVSIATATYNTVFTVTFTTPLDDDDYDIVSLPFFSTTSPGTYQFYSILTRTTTGFTAIAQNGSGDTDTGDWLLSPTVQTPNFLLIR